MKYMHFKASCSYAALAAIMEIIGVDTEDYKIALEIKLPWLFSKEDGAYISGPMLQGAKWFNLSKRSRATPNDSPFCICCRKFHEKTLLLLLVA